jgi:hypothetical protein
MSWCLFVGLSPELHRWSKTATEKIGGGAQQASAVHIVQPGPSHFHPTTESCEGRDASNYGTFLNGTSIRYLIKEWPTAWVRNSAMSFRKRNVVLGSHSKTANAPTAAPQRQEKVLSPGVRPSPLDGRPTTSTGTSSLDQLLAGHSGLPLGTSILIEEAGTTDFGGTVLRYYAAEGLVQGHHVHLLGYGDVWRRDLPGLDLSGGSKHKSSKRDAASDEKMKIAWRYETLGNTSTRNPSQGMYSAPAASHGSTAHNSKRRVHQLHQPEHRHFVMPLISPRDWRTARSKEPSTQHQ